MRRSVPPTALLALLIPLGLGLAILLALAWFWPAVLNGWVATVQASYGAPRPTPGWLRADHHLHLLVACAATLWAGLACRLFLPPALPWAPVGLVVLLAIIDEVAQSLSPARNVEMGDEVAGAIGVALAFPLLLLLARLPVARGGLRGAAPPR